MEVKMLFKDKTKCEYLQSFGNQHEKDEQDVHH
jgi:hypothetical protein